MNYALQVKRAIDKYNDEVLPMIRQGQYEFASIELASSIQAIGLHKDEIPDGRMVAYAEVLEAGLKNLQIALKEKIRIDSCVELVEERMHIVDIYIQGQIDKV